MSATTIWTLLFLAMSAQGMYLGFLILTRTKIVFQTRLYLSQFIFLFSIVLLLWIGFWNGFPEKYPHFNYLYDPPPLLLGPLLLFYIKSYFGKMSRRDLFHLLPFVLIFAWYSPFYLLSADQKSFFISNTTGVEELWRGYRIINVMYWLHSASFVFYGLIIRLYVTKELQIRSNVGSQARQALVTMSILFLIFSGLYFVNYFVRQIPEIPSLVEYLSATLISVFFYIIGYVGLSGSQAIGMIEKGKNSTYARSALSMSKTNDLLQKILQHLKIKKPFLLENYKLQDLSVEVQIPPHHISELLNKYHHQNFSELINTYRIAEAKELLLSKKHQNLKISSIGYSVGFNSKTTFYHWFKKITGESPATFQKKNC